MEMEKDRQSCTVAPTGTRLFNRRVVKIGEEEKKALYRAKKGGKKKTSGKGILFGVLPLEGVRERETAADEKESGELLYLAITNACRGSSNCALRGSRCRNPRRRGKQGRGGENEKKEESLKGECARTRKDVAVWIL